MTEEKDSVDFDFEKFCTELKAENPDKNLIKAGIEKYGTGQLSDSQKEQFLQAMFPEQGTENGLGFSNMSGIKNALKAMNDLKNEEKIDNDAMLKFLTETNSKGGRNVMTTVALNTYAAEYKMANAQSDEIKNLLSTKMEDLSAIQEAFKNIDDDVLAQAICTPDASHGIGGAAERKIQYKDFVERAIRLSEKQSEDSSETSQDSILKENYERVKDKVAKITENQQINSSALNITNADENGEQPALNVQEEGGNLKIGGASGQPALNVEEEENIPDITPAKEEDPSHHGQIKLDRVREGDIIDYMFNDWFLASVNWGNEKLINLLNDTIHNVDRPRTPAPTTSGPQQQQHHNSNTNQQVLQSHQNTINSAQSEGIISSLSKQINENAYSPAEIASVFERTLDDIKLHKGKDPKDWTPCKAVDPVRHAKLIAVWNAKYRENPEVFNKLIEERITAVKTVAPQQLADVSKIAAMYAFLDHVTKTGNVNKELSDSDKKKINGKSKIFTSEILKTSALLQQAETEGYILQHPELGLAQDTPFAQLKPEVKNEISGKTGEKISKYLVGLTNNSAQLMDNVVKCVTTESDKEKETYKKQLKASHSTVKGIITGFGQPLPDEEPVNNQNTTNNNSPRDLRTEAQEFNNAQTRADNVTKGVEVQKSNVEAQKGEIERRKGNFEHMVAKFRPELGNKTPQRTTAMPHILQTTKQGR
ncbi:MAG: hypothetical protein MJ212_01445 [Alphaproteobacteria bacterium]|nr:hypothetical protein [Alphaproteobacteria bacterium]